MPVLSNSADEASVRLAVESSTDCIKVLTLDGKLEYMNEGGLCVMEIDDFDAFKGACWPDFWEGEEAPKARAALDRARAGGIGRFRGYTATAKGNVRYWDVTVSPIPGPRGDVEGLLSVSRDITAEHEAERDRDALLARLALLNERLEAEVEERTRSLRQALQEAEDFNYSISHDLRSPLRAISATSSILMADLGPSLADEYREMLGRQVHNAKRMGGLIDDLLGLSRLARAEVRRAPLDLTAMAREIAAETPNPGGCTFEIQEGLRAEADPVLVRTLLLHLIDNAAKFSPAGGTIRIGGESGVFRVADEGIGFDMAYATKVFLPFERLVAEADYPGRGIGLAQVKRIVARHNGQAWCESAPQKGTTVYFTL